MKVPRTAVVGVVIACLEVGAKRATKYLSDKLVVRATRRCYRVWMSKKTPSALRKFSDSPIEILLTIGKPNNRERQKVKLFKAAGEPFPVKKIQLKW